MKTRPIGLVAAALLLALFAFDAGGQKRERIVFEGTVLQLGEARPESAAWLLNTD